MFFQRFYLIRIGKRMEIKKVKINEIPVIIWGRKSEDIYIFVHGRSSCKEDAIGVAETAIKKGMQVISFDLPEHGERKKNDEKKFIIQDVIPELNEVANYISLYWNRKFLIASSIGAYFSLVAYQNMKIERSIFISPLLDMELLISNMMKWSNVGLKRLKEEREIKTPMGETLSWDYLQYVKQNKISTWNNKIYIIIGDKDELTDLDTVNNFVEKFNCDIEYIKDGKHYLNLDNHQKIIQNWLEKNI